MIHPGRFSPSANSLSADSSIHSSPVLDGLDQHFQAPLLLTAPLINLNNIDNLSSQKFLGMLGIERWAAGCRSKYANYCDMLPPCFLFQCTNRKIKPLTPPTSFQIKKIELLSFVWLNVLHH